jgi:hypothetical protein
MTTNFCFNGKRALVTGAGKGETLPSLCNACMETRFQCCFSVYTCVCIVHVETAVCLSAITVSVSHWWPYSETLGQVSQIQSCPHFTRQFALWTAVLDQTRCPYFTRCPHFAGLLFTGFTVLVLVSLLLAGACEAQSLWVPTGYGWVFGQWP